MADVFIRVFVEAQEGARRNALVPARLEDVRPPFEFRAFHTADLFARPIRKNVEALNDCMHAVATLVGRESKPPAPVPAKSWPRNALTVGGAVALLLFALGLMQLRKSVQEPQTQTTPATTTTAATTDATEMLRQIEARLATDKRGSEVARTALAHATHELRAGVWEQGDASTEATIRKYLTTSGIAPASAKSTLAWSGAFVSWCFVNAASPPPFRASTSNLALRGQMAEQRWLTTAAEREPAPGDIVPDSPPASPPAGE
jgi:hypothetical protein